MGFIRDLYFNNIEVQSIPKQYEGLLKETADQIDKIYKHLSETLFEPHREEFKQYADLVEKFMDDSLLAMFENGFRLGGRCVYDMFLGGEKGAGHEKK